MGKVGINTSFAYPYGFRIIWIAWWDMAQLDFSTTAILATVAVGGRNLGFRFTTCYRGRQSGSAYAEQEGYYM